MRQATAQMWRIFATMPIAIWLKDLQNTFVRVNQTAADLLGYTIEEIEGCEAGDFFEQKAERFWEEDLEIATSGSPMLGIVEEIELIPGMVHTVRKDKIPFRDESGQVVGIIILLTDITEEVRHQQEIKELERRLTRSESFSAIGQATAKVAHDFNNLLTSLLGRGELLGIHASNCECERAEELREQVNQITETIQSASEFSRELLDFAKSSTVKLQNHNLQKFIFDSERILQVCAGQNCSVRIRFFLHERILVKIDSFKLLRLLINLVANARDAGASAVHLSLSVEKCPRRICGPVAIARERACIRISDDGEGIPSEQLEKIFEPFFTTKKGVGTGLGLSSAIETIKAHSGEIDVTSRVGVGTTFTLYLPLAANEE